MTSKHISCYKCPQIFMVDRKSHNVNKKMTCIKSAVKMQQSKKRVAKNDFEILNVCLH